MTGGRCDACGAELSRFATEPVCPTCHACAKHEPPSIPTPRLAPAVWMWSAPEASSALRSRDLATILRERLACRPRWTHRCQGRRRHCPQPPERPTQAGRQQLTASRARNGSRPVAVSGHWVRASVWGRSPSANTEISGDVHVPLRQRPTRGATNTPPGASGTPDRPTLLVNRQPTNPQLQPDLAGRSPRSLRCRQRTHEHFRQQSTKIRRSQREVTSNGRTHRPSTGIGPWSGSCG
jgi:hypothetical protein